MTIPLIRTASVLCWVSGAGFGVFCLPAIREVWSGRDIPIVMGFPAYGHGPFESMGLRSTVPLLAAFLLVCVLEMAAGWLLWGGHRSGAILALGLVPFGALFWWGFALPYGALLGIVRTALLVAGWSSLH